jgi:hypothetical protein
MPKCPTEEAYALPKHLPNGSQGLLLCEPFDVLEQEFCA